MTKAEKELIEVKLQNIALVNSKGFAELTGMLNIVNNKVNNLIEYQKTQNGNIKTALEIGFKSENRINELEGNIIIRFIKKRPGLIIIAGILLILVIFGYVSLDQIFELKKLIP